MKRILCFLLCCVACAHFPIQAEENNAIIVCDNGLEMFGWDLEFIRHAQHAIDVSACFFGGEIARELLREVEARLEVCPDLQVHILATPILLEDEDYAIVNRLQTTYPDHFHFELASNITIVWPDVTGIDNHVKMCVVDEHYFSIGGTNLDSSQCSEGTYTPPRNPNKVNVVANNLPAGMRDQDIVGRGPIAKTMRETFCKLFALWHHYNQTNGLERNPDVFADNPYYFDVTEKPFVARFEASDQPISLEPHQMQFFLGGPHQSQNAITQEYVRLIKGAKKEIKIANLYLSPTEEVFEALLEAVNRGVKLTVITNGISDISAAYTRFFGWANRMAYVPFLYGQTFHFWDYWSVKGKEPHPTRIYEYHVKDVILHKKMMIVDDDLFLLGSYNLGEKSHLSDYESIMVISSPEVVKEINKVHLRDLQYSREVSCEEAIEWYFDPITAYAGEVQKRFSGLI